MLILTDTVSWGTNMQDTAQFGSTLEVAQFGTGLEEALFGGFGVLVDVISYGIISNSRIISNNVISR